MNLALAHALAVLTGVLTFLAFPGWNLHYLAWFCLVPLLVAARDATVKRGFLLGLVAGTVTNVGGFHWMTGMLQEFGHMPATPAWAILVLQAATQGLTMALGVALWRWLAARGAPVALSAWLALWLGEAVVPMIFPWFLGNALSPQLEFIQIAELGGVHLVSALAFAANAAMAELILALFARRSPSWRFVLGTAGAALLTFGYGVWRLPQVDAEQAAATKLKIGMVEGNVGIWEKEAKYLAPRERALTLRHNLLKHQHMSADLERRGAELIVWPESAYQPFGSSPVVHTTDRFLLVGDGGTLLRHDGKGLQALAADRLGLPRDLGLLTGTSSPRGDLWRAIDGGRRVVTVAPQGATVVAVPEGETAVTTLASPVDPAGRLSPGYVVARSGRAWKLAWPTPRSKGAPGPLGPDDTAKLEPLGDPPMGADVTSAALTGAGRLVAVGRGGLVLQIEERTTRKLPAPTEADLWTVAGDPQGALLVAAGSKGTVLTGDGERWVPVSLGTGDLYAAWFGPDGTAYVGGQGGSVWQRTPGKPWQKWPEALPVDVMAGATDADGHVLVAGRGGRVFLREKAGKLKELPGGSHREITAVLGFQAQPSWFIPRSARRVVPATTPLPDAKLKYPDDVLADDGIAEGDRSTPRRGFSAPLLFGAMTHGSALPTQHAGCTDCYNSAVLLGKNGEVQAIHDKAFLLMFGEYIPFGEEFPQLYELSPETSRFQAGTRTAPIELTGSKGQQARLGMLICYEDLVPRYARRVAAHSPNVFVNLTNDAWFGQTAEPEHHLNLALMRTVEYRRWLLRSTNTGISVYIDAAGRRVQETALAGEETMLRDVPLLEGRTLYARLGDWPLLGLGVGLLTLTARTLRGGKTGGAPSPKPAGKKKKAGKASA